MPKLNLKPAASGLNHHSYDVSSVITLDFGELVPTRIIETCLKDRFTKVSANGLIRLAPQGFPAYGKAYVKNAAFFVPEHQLIEYSEALHSNMNTWKGESVVIPHISTAGILWFFVYSNGLPSFALSTSVVTGVTDPASSSAPAEDTYDFVFITNSGGSTVYNYYRFTQLGRYFYKVLKSLGYDLPSFVNDSAYVNAYASGEYDLNALPLLAYCKVYVDMFLNGTMYNNNELVGLLHAIHDHRDFYNSGGTLVYTASNGSLNRYGLVIMMENILLPHETDMYTDAWNSPNSPDGVTPDSRLQSANPDGLISPYYTDQTNNVEKNYGNVRGNYLQHFNGSNVVDLNYLSARGLRLLTAFDKFVRMAHLSGSKAVQRIYARFGLKPDDFNSHFVHKLYEGSSRIQFSPVMSNSDTENSSPSPYSGKGLGSYAGMGISGINMEFSYNPTDFGYIVCVAWLQVVPFITRGCHPQTLRMNSLDFYTPEYDGKTLRPIPLLEISTNKNSKEVSPAIGDKGVFGFANLYDDYREMRDVIAGDFITDKVAKNFLFARDFSWFRNNNVGIMAQDNNVHYWTWQSNPDMTDVFQMASSLGDRFYLYLDWNIEADRPVLSRADAFDLYGPGDTTVAVNGNEIA